MDIIKECLSSWVHVKLLEALMRKPKAMSQRQLAQIVGIPRATTQRALVDLGSTGLIKPQSLGSATYWEIDKQSYLYEALEPILNGLDIMVPALKYLKDMIVKNIFLPKGARCFLFGSTVEGKDTSSSDIDMAIILPGSVSSPSRSLSDSLEVLEDLCREKFGKRLGIVFVKARDVAKHPEKDLHRNILKGVEISK